ncbi:MAG: hypothetical protein MJ171_07410, partial [Clostridia bacterium]|nr:hypothetical protein [Clostridia bacterium]
QKTMKKQKKEDFYDDGRTIVDMSGVGRKELFGRNRNMIDEDHNDISELPKRELPPWEEATKRAQDRKETRQAVKGAILAGILIWAVYAVVFGLVILGMVLLSKRALG